MIDSQQTAAFSDCVAGLAFGFSFPTAAHLSANPANLLLVSAAQASELGLVDNAFVDRMLSESADSNPGHQRLRELRLEFQRLFELPNPTVPPYESNYSSPPRALSDAASRLLPILDRAGLEISASFRDHPDHVSLVLELLARLAQLRCVDESKAAALRQFADQHVLNWIPSFIDRVLLSTEDPYYCSLAQLTGAVLGLARGGTQ